jgi:hypothetical protein
LPAALLGLPYVRSLAVTRINLLFAIFLAGFGTQQGVQNDPERDAENAEMAQCLSRETQAVAPQPVDLETATLAVMTRCHFGEARERAMVAAYPEYRNYIHGLIAKAVP